MSHKYLEAMWMWRSGSGLSQKKAGNWKQRISLSVGNVKENILQLPLFLEKGKSKRLSQKWTTVSVRRYFPWRNFEKPCLFSARFYEKFPGNFFLATTTTSIFFWLFTSEFHSCKKKKTKRISVYFLAYCCIFWKQISVSIISEPRAGYSTICCPILVFRTTSFGK